MRLKLIFPAREIEFGQAVLKSLPLVSAHLAAFTPEGIEVKIVDMLSGDLPDYDEEVDAVGITTRTPVAPRVYKIAQEFRKRGVKVLLGGPHITARPLEASQHADCVVVGEAEELWPHIMEDLLQGKLKPFYVAGPHDVSHLPGPYLHIPHRPSLKNLPLPKRHLLPQERYKMQSIFTTRGCPYGCRFCPVPFLLGDEIRHRPIEEVTAEVNTFGPFYFNVDDNILGHPSEAHYYQDLYRELASLRPRRQWMGSASLSTLTTGEGRKVVERAAQSGLTWAIVGIESINPSAQREASCQEKVGFLPGDLKTLKGLIRLLQSSGIEIIGSFILGWDEDTLETYQQTLDFCDENHIVPLPFVLVPMPGTPLYEEYLTAGRLLPDLNWDQFGGSTIVYKHPHLDPKEMLRVHRAILQKGFTPGRIFKRSLHGITNGASIKDFFQSLALQWGLRKVFAKSLIPKDER